MNKSELVKNLKTIKEIDTQLALGIIKNYHVGALASCRRINSDLLREIYIHRNKYTSKIYSIGDYHIEELLLRMLSNTRCPTDIVMSIWNAPECTYNSYKSRRLKGLAARHPNFDITLFDEIISNLDYFRSYSIGESLMMNPKLTNAQYQKLFLNNWSLMEKASRLKRTTFEQLKIILLNCTQTTITSKYISKVRRNILDRLFKEGKLKIIEE